MRRIMVALVLALGLIALWGERAQAAVDSGMYVCKQSVFRPATCWGIAAFSHRDIVRGRYVVIHGWQGNSRRGGEYTLTVVAAGRNARLLFAQADTLPDTGDVYYRIPLTFWTAGGRYTLRSMTEYRWQVVSKAGVRLATSFVYTGTTNAHPILGGD